MTVAVNVQGPNGEPIATFNLYDDVFEVMVTEAAINGVNVADHIAQIIVGHAEDIIDSIKEDT
ncbi:hypothetical protein, partial [Microbacterium natoriense]|uniref:hypothetical protein n=1 Tax=Microbacterium natoriense TaxID=284570 RepID=UPI0031D3B894